MSLYAKLSLTTHYVNATDIFSRFTLAVKQIKVSLNHFSKIVMFLILLDIERLIFLTRSCSFDSKSFKCKI